MRVKEISVIALQMTKQLSEIQGLKELRIDRVYANKRNKYSKQMFRSMLNIIKTAPKAGCMIGNYIN